MFLGLLCFVIYAPLCLVRKIEKFAITHIFADALILITTIAILVYASQKLANEGWGTGVMALNTATWLDMIGSAVYSYEGIGVVLPLLEVTEKPEMYPKILLYVLLTVMILYVSFGEFCLFVYGSKLELPLITTNLPKGIVVQLIRIFFSINLIFTYPLQLHPASVIIESYLFKGWGKSPKRMWLKNLFRTCLVAFTVVFCLLLGD
jgi:solute carrier family 36 (proton-coupled amino acid transporter)